jgi:predicted DCC family thiol-disulfide oxidoreductase YuxK
MAEIIFKYYISVPACDSVILIHKTADGKWAFCTKSDALLHCAGLLKFPWSLLMILFIFPRRLRDMIYELVAHHRYNIFGKNIKCDLC